MKIGFSSIYSWRPHVEHLAYLARLVRLAGHEARFLTCDSNFGSCYTRELRPKARSNCITCRMGGIRSYEDRHITAIGSAAAAGEQCSSAMKWAESSASTIGRFESDQDYSSGVFAEINARLAPTAMAAYSAARKWIEKERLDAICVFNGRMDATRGIIEAAQSMGIRYVSMERTWFGDGLQLFPNESCLGLKSADRMVGDWRDVPLTEAQALRASSHIASRFLRKNQKEWQAYNTGASAASWPNSGSSKVLLLPGSRNEFYGHPDWEDPWAERTAAYDALIDHLKLKPEDVVLRCHPNWAVSIGQYDGHHSEEYYRTWSKKRGVKFIPAADTSSTLDLIEQADAVVVCGSSAGLEAGVLGKNVIAVGPSNYQTAGFQLDAYGQEQMNKLKLLDSAHDSDNTSRKTLRFAYSTIYRLAQYVDHVRCISTTKYQYLEGANPDRFVALCQTGVLVPDDSTSATSLEGEDSVLNLIQERQWEALMDRRPSQAEGRVTEVRRRPAYRFIDSVRRLLPLGHQW